MARQEIVQLVDDIDGGEANETVQFALDGKHYEIDLSDTHAKALRENLADYIEHGRRIATEPPRRRQRAGGTPARADRAQTQAIRDWARANGHEISERGRIPKAVVDAFNAAH